MYVIYMLVSKNGLYSAKELSNSRFHVHTIYPYVYYVDERSENSCALQQQKECCDSMRA